MKKKSLLFLSLILFLVSGAQNFSGQWKGEFIDKSTSFNGFGGDKCDYVLELECKGTAVSGSSYTYFTDAGKNYYTICTLKGFIDPRQKYIEVREVERIKTNVPVTVRNCLQVHKLTYFKHGDSLTLEGKWEPAPGQDNDCGIGTTLLARRELKQSFPNFNSKASKSFPEKKNNSAKLRATASVMAKKNQRIPGNAIKPKSGNKNNGTAAGAEQPGKNMLRGQTLVPVDSIATSKEPGAIINPLVKFEKRNNTVLKTIQVENKTVKVDLYDNGEIDGDSISLFYNDKLLLSGKRLSAKPISLTIDVEDDVVNELVMYAENLGTIPPNTALMIVTDGPKRYEVRITSDLQKSGVIDFIHKQEKKD